MRSKNNPASSQPDDEDKLSESEAESYGQDPASPLRFPKRQLGRRKQKAISKPITGITDYKNFREVENKIIERIQSLDEIVKSFNQYAKAEELRMALTKFLVIEFKFFPLFNNIIDIENSMQKTIQSYEAAPKSKNYDIEAWKNSLALIQRQRLSLQKTYDAILEKTVNLIKTMEVEKSPNVKLNELINRVKDKFPRAMPVAGFFSIIHEQTHEAKLIDPQQTPRSPKSQRKK